MFRFASPFLDLMDELLGNEVVDEDEEDESDLMSPEEADEGYKNLMRCLSGKLFPKNYAEEGDEEDEDDDDDDDDEEEEEAYDEEETNAKQEVETDSGEDLNDEMDDMEVDVSDSSEDSNVNN